MHIHCPHCHNPIEIVAVTTAEVGCPSCGSSFRLEDASTTAWPPPTKRLGKFDLLDKLGQGAFGTVYKARDAELDRLVAVKVPRVDNLPEAGSLDRFLREARSVAQLRHPSIVAVHEVGQSDGLPYLISDLVEGITLADYLSSRQPSQREAAQWVATAAEALHYAHQQGVIHRDVKPSNIMLEHAGAAAPVLKLMDFGLAKREAGEITMTLEGQVLGTPAYMSPEQAKGAAHAVDGRSDVYSLGVILYRLLTGDLPFRGTPRMLLHQVLHDEPRGPRSLNERIPRDLETICLKAMAKEPQRRYLSAAALADDLRHWLKGEPIQARPVGRLERTAKWVRRNPGLSAGLTTAVLSLVLGTALATWQAVQARLAADNEATQRQTAENERKAADVARQTAQDEKKAADAARKNAEDKELLATTALQQVKKALFRIESMQYIDHIGAADKALLGDDLCSARWHLDECRLEFRHVEYGYLRKQLAQQPLTLRGHTNGVLSMALSSDGKRLCSGSVDQTIKVWDLEAGKETLTLRGHTSFVHSLALSPDGKRLCSGSGNYQKPGEPGEIKVWNLESGQETFSLRGHMGQVRSLALSSDGKRLISGGGGRGYLDNTIKVWDLEAGKETLTLRGHPKWVLSLVLSSDGKRLFSASSDQTIKVWDLEAGMEITTLHSHTGPVSCLALSSDGKRLFSGSVDKTIKVWNLESGQETLTLRGHTDKVTSLVLSTDGKRLFSGSGDLSGSSKPGEIKVWNLESGQETLTLRGHTNGVLSMALSSDGKRLCSGSWDKTIKVWDLEACKENLTLRGQTGQVSSLALSSDGKRLCSGSWNWFLDKYKDRVPSAITGEIKVWDVEAGQEALILRGHTANVSSLALSSDGKRLCSGSQDQTIKVWDLEPAKETLTLRGHTAAVLSLALSSDGKRLCSGSQDQTIKVWDLEAGKETITLRGHTAAVSSLALSSDGKRLCSGSQDQTIKVWDLEPAKETLTLRGHAAAVLSLALSSDGKRLFSGSQDQTIKGWDLEAGKEALTLRGHADEVSSLVLSSDGKRLFSGSGDQTIKVWNLDANKETLTLRGHTHFVTSLALSSDDKRLFSGSGDQTIKVWAMGGQ